MSRACSGLLVPTHVLVFVACLAALWPSIDIAAQSAPAAGALEFDAVSVKPQRDPTVSPSMNARSSGFRARKWTTATLLSYTYNFPRDRILNAPDWVDSNQYDMVGRTNREGVTISDVHEMVKALLADRFQLRAHVEERNAQIYALVMARRDGKLGPGLRRAAGCQENHVTSAATRDGDNKATRPCGTRVVMDRMLVTVESGGKPLSDLVWALQGPVGRKVIDKTGLEGAFDFDLRFTPFGAPSDVGDAPAIFTAIREQLGLELKSEEGTVEVLVIDNIAQPAPD